jgi:hypothetical protein
MTRALLVLGMGGLGTPKRAGQLRRGRERRAIRVDSAGQPARNLVLPSGSWNEENDP